MIRVLQFLIFVFDFLLESALLSVNVNNERGRGGSVEEREKVSFKGLPEKYNTHTQTHTIHQLPFVVFTTLLCFLVTNTQNSYRKGDLYYLLQSLPRATLVLAVTPGSKLFSAEDVTLFSLSIPTTRAHAKDNFEK